MKMIFTEASHDLPIVDLDIIFCTGALLDESGKEGSMRMLAKLMRRGPKGMDMERFNQVLDGLGASMSFEVGHSSFRVSASVLARNAKTFVELVFTVLDNPALRPSDFKKVKRDAAVELDSLLDEDRFLCMRMLRPHVLGTAGLGRTVIGSKASIKRIGESEIKNAYQNLRKAEVVVGVSGDFDDGWMAWFEQKMSKTFVMRKPKEIKQLNTHKPVDKNTLLVINKPDRDQTQLYLGALAPRITDKHYIPFSVANHVFGGSFTSRLTKEVRSKRGWSYGSRSSLGLDPRGQEMWTVWTHPSVEQAPDCLKLKLDLIEAWKAKGISAAELKKSLSFLKKSHAFDVDTAHKRLEPKLDASVYGVKETLFTDMVNLAQKVTVQSAAQSIKSTLSHQAMTVCVLGPASTLVKPLEKNFDDVVVVKPEMLIQGS